jgi:hypothetical protein
MTSELVYNTIALAGTLPFVVMPRRARFRAGLAASRLLAPVVGRPLLRRYGNVVGSATDETTRVLFRAMARMRVRLPTQFTADFDADDLAETLKRGGAIFVTAHFPMNPVFTRWLADRGHVPVMVRVNDGISPMIWGTLARPDLLHPGPNTLIQIRRALRQQRLVLLAIDRALDIARSLRFESRFGTTAIATPVFAFARKLNVPLFFIGARATRNGLPVVTVRRIAYDPSAFVEEFRRHTEAMLDR